MADDKPFPGSPAHEEINIEQVHNTVFIAIGLGPDVARRQPIDERIHVDQVGVTGAAPTTP